MKTKRILFPTILANMILGYALSSCQPTKNPEGCCQLDYEKINAQALKEYETPIRPGYEGQNPYWNVYAKKFIYAPSFDFQNIKDAVKYRFTLHQTKDSTTTYTFDAETPTAALSPIWSKLPVGKTNLIVEGLDKDGKILGTAGTRTFFRDYPFEGPYTPKARNYREAALKAMLFVHNISPIQHWLTHTEPDMSFENNTYACKIIGATIRLECLLAKEMPTVKEEALKIARNAAECLIQHSFAEGTPLAYFPPTYYLEPDAKDGWPHHIYTINQGKTMFLEAVAPAQAFLDLYEATQEERYKEQALHIADTYQCLQNEDGSYPIKVTIEDGKNVENAYCIPVPLYQLIQRLHKDYNITKYDDIISKSEQWVNEHALKTFNMTGQFEDQRMEDLKPYENLTNCTANDYAEHLLTKENVTEEEIQNATDLIRLSEDQFVHWNSMPDSNGFSKEATPCVHEQYFYETPVDASARGMAMAFYSLYKKTNNPIDLAKALALVDEITKVQNITNGQIPTTWEFTSGQWDYHRTFWPNCTYYCVKALLYFDKEFNNNTAEK